MEGNALELLADIDAAIRSWQQLGVVLAVVLDWIAGTSAAVRWKQFSARKVANVYRNGFLVAFIYFCVQVVIRRWLSGNVEFWTITAALVPVVVGLGASVVRNVKLACK
jgi:hypothetical protein